MRFELLQHESLHDVVPQSQSSPVSTRPLPQTGSPHVSLGTFSRHIPCVEYVCMREYAPPELKKSSMSSNV